MNSVTNFLDLAQKGDNEVEVKLNARYEPVIN